MTELELFEKWCENQIALQEEQRKQDELCNVPKWERMKNFNRSLAPDCYSSLKSLKIFKELVLNK